MSNPPLGRRARANAAAPQTGEPRTCTRCGLTKPAVEFANAYQCRACATEWRRTNYLLKDRVAHAARTQADRKVRREHSRQRLFEYKMTHPCVDCGEADPVVLQFDHQGDKYDNVSKMVQRGAVWASVEREIAKCLVRCANCHARKTARDQGWSKALLADAVYPPTP